MLRHHDNRNELAQHVSRYMEQEVGRRTFLQRTAALGLAVSSVGTLLASCGGDSEQSASQNATSVDVLNVWGTEEQESFKAVVAPFTSKTKITVNIEATRDLDAVLTTRIRGNNPPDIAILPNPGKMQQLASQKKLVRLDTFLDMNQVHRDYAEDWIKLGSYNDGFHALFYKAANKATIWYNPKELKTFTANLPTNWSELIALSDKIAASGKYPWSMGVESGAASGWPAADWIAQIYLSQAGRELYDQWVSHQIPWTHPSVEQAFQTFGQIVSGKHYIHGAPKSILATGFQDASYPPFSVPPKAYLYYLGDFTAGFITSQYPKAKPGSDFNFFPFPVVNQAYQGAVTGGADLVVAMRDNNAVREFVKYLASAEAQTIWVKRGGFTSVNKSVDLKAYPNPIAQASAKTLTEASTFRFGAGDLMPPAVQQAFWKGVLTFIGDQKKLDAVLSAIEDASA